MSEELSQQENKIIEELKSANEIIEANKETDEHKRIALKICAEIAKEKDGGRQCRK